MLENRITGCHGNYAHISTNRFIFGKHFFTLRGGGGQGNNSASIKIVLGGEGRLN